MGSNDIKYFILDLISEKLSVFNIKRGEVNSDFDLVKSGLLDSMSFIDLVAELEDKYKLEVDFEEAADNNDFTTMTGLIQLITDTKNA
jgi:acyl carrier protein